MYKNEALEEVTLDPTQCPAGRILRETGRKLYPGVNPGVTQYYIGVYDAVSFLNGFIDPNNGVFAEFNNNKPTWVGDNCSDDGSDDCSWPDLGDPVFTRGNIIAIGDRNLNYISLQNDEDGRNAAYFGYAGESFLPYVGVEGVYDEVSTSTYLGVNPCESYLALQYNLSTNVYLSSGDGSSSRPPILQTTGLLNPVNTCGTMQLEGGICTVTGSDIPFIDASGVILFLTYNESAGSWNPGNAGILSYSISGTSLTINSTNNSDYNYVNYMLVSQYKFSNSSC